MRSSKPIRWLLIGAALLLAACQPAPTLHSQESYVFGTRVEVLVWGEPEPKARAAAGEVLREFDRLHRVYHAWQPSELTALNDAIADGRSLEVSAELAQLLKDAQTLSAQGEHLFDPGIGALVALWGFHDDSFRPQLPEPQKLAALLKAKPSIADLTVTKGPCPPPGRAPKEVPLGDPKTGTANGPTPRSGEPPSPPPVGGGSCVLSRNRAVALDFGGYLKGIALDRAAAILKRAGVANALINIGGNVMALGSKSGTPWRVGIQHPRATTPLATLDLFDGEAIGTSGDYQRYFELDGQRYCHLIDPRSGTPACSDGASGTPSVGTQAVTLLISPRPDAGLWSDAASKPVFLAGTDWRRMAGKLGLEQVLRVDAAGRVEVTEALRPRLKMVPNP